MNPIKFKDITKFLNVGKEHAKNQKQLVQETGLSPRELRAAIHTARCKGALILSNTNKRNGGYYLPKNKEEVQRYIEFQKNRIKSAEAAMKSAEESLC